MTAYTFCIDQWFVATISTNLYEMYIILWQMETKPPCERETGNLHNPQAVAIKAIDGTVGTLQVVGHVASYQGKYL